MINKDIMRAKRNLRFCILTAKNKSLIPENQKQFNYKTKNILHKNLFYGFEIIQILKMTYGGNAPRSSILIFM